MLVVQHKLCKIVASVNMHLFLCCQTKWCICKEALLFCTLTVAADYFMNIPRLKALALIKYII